MVARMRSLLGRISGEHTTRQQVRQRLILIAGSSLILLVVIYFGVVLLTVSSTRLELLTLKQEIETGSPCHESCRLKRQELKQRIASAWQDDKKLRADLEYYLFSSSPESSPELVRELLEIIVLADATSGPPELIFDYLANSEGRGEIKAQIINLFLSPLADSDLVNYYLALLTSGEEEVVLAAAVKALSQLPDKSVWQTDDLKIYSELIVAGELSPALRLDLYFLINSYQEIFPQEAAATFVYIYEASLEDEFKALAADSLSKLGLEGYEAPIFPEEKWVQYFDIKR